jgi:predicted nuclease of predicted toxin-antitoxin system
MNFVADESLDAPIIAALRSVGHDVYSIQELHPQINDETVLEISREQNRILLTSDKDFGELVYRLKLVSAGIVLLRIPELSHAEKASLVLLLIQTHGDKLNASFCVVKFDKIRILSL